MRCHLLVFCLTDGCRGCLGSIVSIVSTELEVHELKLHQPRPPQDHLMTITLDNSIEPDSAGVQEKLTLSKWYCPHSLLPVQIWASMNWCDEIKQQNQASSFRYRD
ncbi:unnamed protein product [Protopolystoma xenopodis]|uniref:Uncharacterized protein n=1 Tax=Protopolystoma xenopodis TaxID=117903 RepID=A0A448XDY0_9PLAT|nr:unnamed protein product [Protopolystoma xenopodis]